MNNQLPTGVFGSWSVTSLRDSLHDELTRDRTSKVLRMFFYAVSDRGWKEIREAVTKWRIAIGDRIVVAFIGTDHGITDPSALESMKTDGIDVRLMKNYQGVFHPKVVWLEGPRANIVWIGSNNLTRDGLLRNIEFAVVVRSADTPHELKKWADAVEAGGAVLTPALLSSYRDERSEFEAKRALAKATTFTWSQKNEPNLLQVGDAVPGDLIIEVMPKETGNDGKQIQLPKAAVKAFFGITKANSQMTVVLNPKGSTEFRQLTMTVFRNHTIRLSINDLEYRDRPCVIAFRKMNDQRITFEIVPQNIFPSRYKALLARCRRRTRRGSRRWTIVESAKL